MSFRVAIIGAGIGGLAAAVKLAAQGLDVTVFERAALPGGKMRQLPAGPTQVDAGPTVFTMRWVFDQLFEEAGSKLEDHVTLMPLDCLARHAWSQSERLDLFADVERSADAIHAFAGPREAQGYRDFCSRAASVYRTLENPFIRSSQPTPLSMAMATGFAGLPDLWRISPFASLWSALGEHFRDSRLRQLFGRYATYCGSSPFLCPATLMLVAHVEQAGVWRIEGGMSLLAAAVARLAQAKGAVLRYETGVTEIDVSDRGVTGIRLQDGEWFSCDGVIVNADPNAVATGLFGNGASLAVDATLPSMRSLSAMTWTLYAKTSRFPLSHHNVFFSRDYEAEFRSIFHDGRAPFEPTVYVCAQDRCDGEAEPRQEAERLLVLVNAPATGDRHPYPDTEIEQCQQRAMAVLTRCGLEVDWQPGLATATSPRDFSMLFPATGGALYGQASHGWAASFTRPEARTRIPGLYLAGGGVHPGAGVPMAAISGWLAAESLIVDRNSRTRWSRVAMPGGTSMR
jgi:1-hydroxycarotenoid 3,4-desaturase